MGQLNPSWNQEFTEEEIFARFEKAMEMAGSEFVSAVEHLRDSWLPARALVLDAVNKRKEYDPSGQIMVLEQFTAWKGHLNDIEREMKLDDEIKYVLYADSSKKWRVQAVSVAPDSFDSRKALPERTFSFCIRSLLLTPLCLYVSLSLFLPYQ